MSLFIHNYFKFYSAKDLFSEYSEFSDNGFVLNFQGPVSSSRYHNGISFTEIQSENIFIDNDDGTVTEIPGDGEDYTYDYLMWTPSKIIAPHSETSGEVDPSRGNRIVSAPILIERVGVATVMKFQLAHSKAQRIEYQSYNTGTHNLTLRFKEIQSGGAITEWKNQQLIVAADLPLETADTFTGRGGLTIDIKSTVEEWLGNVVSFDGKTMVLNIPTPPSPTSKLADVNWIGPNNQTLFILPLGHVEESGIEQYSVNATSLALYDWTYYDADAYSTDKYKVVTPKIENTFTDIGERDKYIAVIERDKTLTNFGNGFKLLADIFT